MKNPPKTLTMKQRMTKLGMTKHIKKLRQKKPKMHRHLSFHHRHPHPFLLRATPIMATLMPHL